jgi:hypothetical protein
MNLRERLVPYLLLGVLALGTGLGVGLGLSEAPVARPLGWVAYAPGAYALASETCVPFATADKAGVTCATDGSGVSAKFTITALQLTPGQASCLPQQLPVTTGPDALTKALAYLERQCGDR